MDEVKLIEAIYCSKERRGKGVEFSPIRVINQIYNKDGSLIMESDPEVKYTDLHLLDLMKWINPVLDLELRQNLLRSFKNNVELK